MKAALRTVLLGKTDVTDICGTRIYSEPWPQGPTYPLLSLDVPVQVSQHDSLGSSGISADTWDITCAAETDTEATDLANAVRIAIDTTTAVDWGVFSIHEVVLVSQITLPPESEDTGKQTALHRIVLSFDIRRSETVASP